LFSLGYLQDLNHGSDAELKDTGEQGWKLVSVMPVDSPGIIVGTTNAIALFKRPQQEQYNRIISRGRSFFTPVNSTFGTADRRVHDGIRQDFGVQDVGRPVPDLASFPGCGARRTKSLNVPHPSALVVCGRRSAPDGNGAVAHSEPCQAASGRVAVLVSGTPAGAPFPDIHRAHHCGIGKYDHYGQDYVMAEPGTRGYRRVGDVDILSSIARWQSLRGTH